MNRSGRTGRDGEHSAIQYLTSAGFLNVEREGRRAASLDLVAPDLSTPIEVKRQATLSIPAWTRKLEDVHGDRWALFVIQRDARKRVHPDLMVFPAAFGATLLRTYENLEAIDRVVQEVYRTDHPEVYEENA